MRLFGAVTGNIDNRDRAGWLTPPFEKILDLASTLFYVKQETREFSVEAEDRTFDVPLETRTFEV